MSTTVKNVMRTIAITRALRRLKSVGEGLSVPGENYKSQELLIAEQALKELTKVRQELMEGHLAKWVLSKM